MYRVTLETENETYEYDINEPTEPKAINRAIKRLWVAIGHRPKVLNIDIVRIKLK